MHAVNDSLKKSSLSAVKDMARLGHTAEMAARIGHFIEAYLADQPPEEIALFSTVDLFGAAMAHWRFAQERPAGNAKIRAYNPVFDEHGWQSPHTIIEIVTDDMPFIVDSVCLALNRLGLTLHLVIQAVMPIARNADGRWQTTATTPHAEALVHIEVDRQMSGEALRALEGDLQRVLADVRAAVDDWRAMRNTLAAVIETHEASPPAGFPAEDIEETQAFLQWLADDHFIFLGYQAFHYRNDASQLEPDAPGLGVLRPQLGRAELAARVLTERDTPAYTGKPELILLTKASSRSTVHRAGWLDAVIVYRFNPQGELIGEYRFVGQYSSAFYTDSLFDIPILRRKLQHLMQLAGCSASSRQGHALRHALEHFPRDELWEFPTDKLHATTKAILHLQTRQQVKLFVREDRFGRFVSCLVFVPRDNYTTEIRFQMQRILMESFNGVSAEFNVSLTESVLARLHFVVRTPNGIPADYGVQPIEDRILDACRRWRDHLQLRLIEHFGEEQGAGLFRTYAEAFPDNYRGEYLPRVAVADIEKIQSLRDEEDLGLSLYNRNSSLGSGLHLKIYRLGEAIGLASTLDILENLGVEAIEERPYRISPIGRLPVWISDFGLKLSTAIENPLTRQYFQEAFAQVYLGRIDNDGFNQLVLLAGLEWREANLLRAGWRYLRQCGAGFSQRYVERCLAHHPVIAAKLIELFHARLSPVRRHSPQALLGEIQTLLNDVPSLDEDRILSNFLSLIQAVVRTNYYQRDPDGQPKPWLTLTLDPAQLPAMSEPRPWKEYFVYSVDFEGIYLKAGPIARGPVRWSDRPEDFRNEALELMNRQRLNNAAIVATGAYGAFICKKPAPEHREDWLEQGRKAFEGFIRGLLDVADNERAYLISPPDAVIRHDGNDPYLAIATGKGTDAFANTANQVAREYEFWLDDAFACEENRLEDQRHLSAQGIWESARRHFRKLGVDLPNSSITAIGVGGPAHPVLGPALLLSDQLRLIAAFDEHDILIDPNPDPLRSQAERVRLLQQRGARWADYRGEFLSKGGAVYSRQQKSITLSPEARLALNCRSERLSPNELIREILKMSADLMLAAGNGCIVKASTQTHADANDRALDAIRVNASDLRVQVVVEGAPQGFTQAARVEFALNGGMIHTDAIDLAAGLNAVDREVNIKILLNSMLHAGDLSWKQRQQMLDEARQAIATMVIRDVEQATLALETSDVIAAQLLHVHTRHLQHLEAQGWLNRQQECLPGNDEIARRKLAGRGLTRPEQAVLTAYAKLEAYPEILNSELPREIEALPTLAKYFPPTVVAHCADYLPRHPLRLEIIATTITNELINRMGATFLFRLNDETGASKPAIAEAWMAASRIFDAPGLWGAIEALDGVIPGPVQVRLLLETRKLLERATRWILRNFPARHDIDSVMDDYIAATLQFRELLPSLLPSSARPLLAAQEQALIGAGVPKPLAVLMARAEHLLAILDLLQVDNSLQIGLDVVARVYFDIGERLGLDWIRQAINALSRENRWEVLARISLREDAYRIHRALTALILQGVEPPVDPAERVNHWFSRHADGVSKVRSFLHELRTQSTASLAMLSGALREYRNQLLTL